MPISFVSGMKPTCFQLLNIPLYFFSQLINQSELDITDKIRRFFYRLGSKNAKIQIELS